MKKSALKIAGIAKAFGNHIAVDGVSFEVQRGVVYGILGPNGAGKSTILRMINDIIAPDRGSIEILDGMPPGAEAAAKIGYLPEERGLYPKMKVGEIVEFMGELRGLSRAEARKRGGAWLDRLGLGKWTKNKVQDLSKGMQQKVQFATALLHEPELVILDEPWSGLDPINAEVLREVVSEIRASGRTVLFSTHQMEQAEKIVDAVCIIARGKMVLEGNLREIKKTIWGGRRHQAWIALGYADDASREKADAPLHDTALVAAQRPPHASEVTDCEVQTAEGVEPQQLLATLVAAGVVLRHFEIMVPTLHQIFVESVGPEAAVAERTEGEAA
ncbi:MAG: ATP-binding cassette domain-containing protein [Deltaproteobacteria bacterium]|nr:ATP-binding cassette domain-containing protein [Deltaproteobacteria bacterium]